MNNPLHIALLTDGIPPFVMGGMQKHSKLIAEYAAREGVLITLFHYVEGEDLPTDQEVLSHFSEAAAANISVLSFRYTDAGKLPGHYLRAQRKLSVQYLEALLALKTPFDFIYSKGFTGWELLRQRERLGYAVRIAVKFHGMNMFQKQPDLKGEVLKFMLRPPVKEIMNKADLVYSYGGKITSIIQAQLQQPGKVVELPSGIDETWVAAQPSSNPPPLKFVFVGRFDRLKGLPELYKALDHASLRQTEFSLALIGPIPPSHQKKDKRLNYLGAIHNQEEMKAAIDMADVLICPSISEGMPNVIMEAMSRGLAVVASDVGATALLVDASNGVLIGPGSSREIVHGLETMISMSESELKALKMNSLERISSEFIWPDIGKRFVNQLKEIVSN